jgi:hypothetical protein
MNISDEKLDEFIELHKKEFGITLSKSEAEEQAKALISLIRIVYK